jgi:uncharacterized protein YecE (DUF72 family)
MNMSKSYYAGLSGLQLPVPKYRFPEPHQASSRLTYYATFFNSIEINSSFYKIPRLATIAKWAAQVPDQFKFTFKLFKEITHAKNLNFNSADVAQFMENISAVGDKKGCLLVQFPPSLTNDHINRLDKLLNAIQQVDPTQLWKVAVEFRSGSWYNEDVYELLNFYNATMVIHDKGASATPRSDLQSELIYVRFHGPAGNYRGSYTDDFLGEYESYINEWLEDGKTVYVYFNNTMGEAFQNLRTLNDFAHARPFAP